MREYLKMFWEDWKMFKELLGVAKPDCQWSLFCEFIFDLPALRERYQKELIFKERMKSGWHQSKPRKKRKKKKVQ